MSILSVVVSRSATTSTLTQCTVLPHTQPYLLLSSQPPRMGVYIPLTRDSRVEEVSLFLLVRCNHDMALSLCLVPNCFLWQTREGQCVALGLTTFTHPSCLLFLLPTVNYDMVLCEDMEAYHCATINPVEPRLVAVCNSYTGTSLYDIRRKSKR